MEWGRRTWCVYCVRVFSTRRRTGKYKSSYYEATCTFRIFGNNLIIKANHPKPHPTHPTIFFLRTVKKYFVLLRSNLYFPENWISKKKTSYYISYCFRDTVLFFIAKQPVFSGNLDFNKICARREHFFNGCLNLSARAPRAPGS